MPEIINFCKTTIGSCKFIQLAIFASKFVCTVLTNLLTRFCVANAVSKPTLLLVLCNVQAQIKMLLRVTC